MFESIEVWLLLFAGVMLMLAVTFRWLWPAIAYLFVTLAFFMLLMFIYRSIFVGRPILSTESDLTPQPGEKGLVPNPTSSITMHPLVQPD